MTDSSDDHKKTDTVPVRSDTDTWGMGDANDGNRVNLPPVFPREVLAGMNKPTLLSHCENLQKACAQLNGDNKVLSWELRESNDYLLRFARVAQIAHYLNASDLDNVADLAINELPQYLNCRFAAFYLYDQGKEEFTLYHSTHPFEDSPAAAEGGNGGHLFNRLFTSREEPYILEYLDGSYKIDSGGDYATMFASTGRWHDLLGDTAMIFPLLTNRPGEAPLILGGLIIGNPAARLTEKDAEVSLMFVDLLSSSLYNAKLVRQLNRMATTDSLTGLYNRRQFITEVEKAIAHTTRTSQPLSVTMLDIDHFKKVNDDYGHLGGDVVLKELGALLSESLRKNVDIPARYGGEEFVMIMPYTRLDQAVAVSERIRYAVEELPISFEGHILRITCSIGVAEFIPGESYNRLIDRADAALYRAKNAGRNRVAAIAGDDVQGDR